MSPTGIAALFVPADRESRAKKALSSGADIVILDLEDAVGTESKSIARENLSPLVSDASHSTNIVIRINPLDSDTGQDDLNEVSKIAQAFPNSISIMIPKIAVRVLPDSLPFPVIGLVESAEGVIDIPKLARHKVISRLALGAIDLSLDLGCEADSRVIDYVRSEMVIHSAFAGLIPPLESPCTDFKEISKVQIAAQRARQDGFGGMMCIHPAQLDIVSSVFRPTKQELDWAKGVIVAAEEGDSAVQIDGKMIDRPVILRAKRILEAAE